MPKPHPEFFAVIVMGVSGCGKSTVGELLAKRLGVEFIEGDQYHPVENVAKMAAGEPLTDADRHGWLMTLADKLAYARSTKKSVVLSCSALKESYRDILRQGASDVWFVYLSGSFEVLNARVIARNHQYMPPSLLHSQLATLEPPKAAARVLEYDITKSPAEIVDLVQVQLLSQA